MCRWFLVLALGLTSSKAWSVSFLFDNIDQTKMNSIVSEFSANLAASSVSGASSLGRVFGLEVGAVASVTNTPLIDAIVKAESPTSTADKLANATLVGRLSVPMGITGEIHFIPSIGSDTSFKFSNMAFGASWTITDTPMLALPFNLAARMMITKPKISFTQTTNNASTGNTDVTTSIEFKDTIFSFMALASKSFAVIEPYVGLGYASGSGTLSFSAASAGTIFDPGLSTTSSATGKKSGMQFLAGAELNLLILNFGVEWSKLLGTSKILGKVSLTF